MVFEFYWAIKTGYLEMWIYQFIICTWWNLFLIVSSHDFEESETQSDLTNGQDWAAF